MMPVLLHSALPRLYIPVALCFLLHRVGGTPLYKSLMQDYVSRLPGAYKSKKDKRSEPEKKGVRLFQTFKRLDLTEQMRYKEEAKKEQMNAMRATNTRCPVPDTFRKGLKVLLPVGTSQEPATVRPGHLGLLA